jgi:hypothetical protein
MGHLLRAIYGSMISWRRRARNFSAAANGCPADGAQLDDPQVLAQGEQRIQASTLT